MTQTDKILAMLKRGPITPLDALREAQCLRLCARIYDLKQLGHQITKENHQLTSGKVVARYHLQKEAA